MTFRDCIIKYYSCGQVQLDFLDTIDFLPMMKEGIDIEDIMRDIEDKYDYGYMRDKLPLELKGCAFNCLDAYDFKLYLEDRYPEWYAREHTKTWYILEKRE